MAREERKYSNKSESEDEDASDTPPKKEMVLTKINKK